MTIRKLLSLSSEYLSEKGSATPRLDAEILLSHTLDCERLSLYLDHDRPLNQEELDTLRSLLRKRASGCPVAYLTGKKEFCSLPFLVNPSVLIPRPETELLVEEALKTLEGIPGQEVHVLDLGTGSGNIAVAIAFREERATITATDISPEALSTALENAKLNGVESRISFACGDLFTPLLPDKSGKKFHLILSNPPYIPESQWKELPRDVRDFEPRTALFSGQDPLSFHKRILQESPHFLENGCEVLLEIGMSTEGELIAFARALEAYSLPELLPDYQGINRVFKILRR